MNDTAPLPAARPRRNWWWVSMAALMMAVLVVWSVVVWVRYWPHRAAQTPFSAQRWAADANDRTGLALDLIASGTLLHRSPRDVEQLLGPPDHAYVPARESASTPHKQRLPGFARLEPEPGAGAVAYALGAPVESVGALLRRDVPTPRFLIVHYRTPADKRAGGPVVVDVWIDPSVPGGS